MTATEARKLLFSSVGNSFIRLSNTEFVRAAKFSSPWTLGTLGANTHKAIDAAINATLDEFCEKTTRPPFTTGQRRMFKAGILSFCFAELFDQVATVVDSSPAVDEALKLIKQLGLDADLHVVKIDGEGNIVLDEKTKSPTIPMDVVGSAACTSCTQPPTAA